MSENKINIKNYGETEVFDGESYESLYKRTVKNTGFEALGVKCGNTICELADKVSYNGEIEFIDITHNEGMRIYCASASLLLIKACQDVMGKDVPVFIENTINNNYYCEIRDGKTEAEPELLEKIEKRMKDLVEADIPFEKVYMKKDDAIDICNALGHFDKSRLLKYVKYSTIYMYKIDDFYDYFYGYMVPSSGYIKKFALVKYSNGFLLQFPSVENSDILQSYDNFDKISQVFIEQLEWCKLMKVNHIAGLNDIISKGNFEELVRINEALHEKKIAQIADMIAEKRDKIKLVLIAGPSSSGKTTFAQRLCVQLRVNGITPHVIGMDDFFVNRDETPLDDDGKPDYENINALDITLFNNVMNSLIKGEEVNMPSYNFITGRKEYNGRKIKLNDGDIIVCEGIHGLNDRLTKLIPHENKFKIFISALTQLNIDAHNRVSTTDSRLIRRIVRDYHFRGNSAAKTIESWPSVRRGEVKNIFPYQEKADVMFNSTTIYELCVLKSHIEPLLFGIDKSMPEYITARRLLKLMDIVLGVDGCSVPNNSIIREFIGGSVFKV